MSRAASELMCDVCSENKPSKSHTPAKLADSYTEFNQGVGVDLFVLADSDEHVLVFLNIADRATRVNKLLSISIQKARRRFVGT